MVKQFCRSCVYIYIHRHYVLFIQADTGPLIQVYFAVIFISSFWKVPYEPVPNCLSYELHFFLTVRTEQKTK